eukprot:GEMP01023795.1.p1 GENE.GEMP01023795.1~~GEMP01023795.1.p1  ORF type:complete len:173 (+),score=20.70 GEMP01023795.1:827-1345(+)
MELPLMGVPLHTSAFRKVVQVLIEAGVKAIVCCCPYPEYPEIAELEGFAYFRVDVEDISREPISAYFDEATEFIRNYLLRDEAVLVHCRSGVSRSATIVLSYLVARQDFTLHDAFFLVRAHRSVITPNLGFMQQLCLYEEAVREEDTTLDMGKYTDWYTSEQEGVPNLLNEP